MPLTLSACGFQPIYAPGGSADLLNGRVEVSQPDSRETYLLVRNLEERLGRSTAPAYRLNVQARLLEEPQAISPDDSINSYAVRGFADYQLVDAATGAVAGSGQVSNFTSYSAEGSTIETLAAQRDARRRLMVILADQLTTQIYATADLSA